MDIQTFDFERLPKVSSQDVELLKALQNYLPRVGFSEKLAATVKALVAKELGLKFSLRRERVTTVALSEKMASLPQQGVYAVLGMQPVDEKAFLELDPLLSHMMIDKLLGGTGEPLTMIRSLTEIETGVLAYLFLKILSEIFTRLGESARVHFRLEGLYSSPDDVAKIVGGGNHAVLMSFRLTLGDRAGYARLFLPMPFVHQLSLDPMTNGNPVGMEETAESTGREFEYFTARLNNFHFIPAELFCELGRSTLMAGAVNQLDVGDVILLEETAARSDSGQLGGDVLLRVGHGEHGAYRARVESDKASVKFRIIGMELDGRM